MFQDCLLFPRYDYAVEADNVVINVFDATNTLEKNCQCGQSFQPSPIFVGKAGAYPVTCSNAKTTFHLGTSGGQNFKLYLNVVNFSH